MAQTKTRGRKAIPTIYYRGTINLDDKKYISEMEFDKIYLKSKNQAYVERHLRNIVRLKLNKLIGKRIDLGDIQFNFYRNDKKVYFAHL